MMTMERNGGIAYGDRPPIQLGNFLKDKTVVVINGQPYEAWVTTNKSYPRRLMAQLDRARVRYMRIAAPLLVAPPTNEELARLSDEEKAEIERVREHAAERYDEAYQAYLTDSLMILIPALDEETAELIPEPVAKQLLIDLGYFEPPKGPVEPPKEGAEQPDPLIGATSPPDSAASTPATESSSN